MTAALAGEWDRHQSLFALRWRAEMRSPAKIVDIVDVENAIGRSQVAMSPAVMKDLHLVEAALATDKVVVSLDNRARAELWVHATREITWVNAVADGGHATYWLKKGAKPVKRWKLGHHP
jgi:hypothetical protein